MLSRINATAPTRICDLGGWTDTWFAGQGYVLNMAVQPCAEVQILVSPRSSRSEPIVLHVENYGERYTPVSYTHLDVYKRQPLARLIYRS